MVDSIRQFDFKRTGWPSWYPTRTLEQWKAAKHTWEPWVFRDIDSKMKRPDLVYPNKKRKRK